RRPLGEFLLAQQLADQLQGRLARVERLHVDVDVRAGLTGTAQERAEAPGGVFDSAPGRLRVQHRAERRHLDRQVCPWDGSSRVALELGAWRPARRSAPEDAQGI